MHARFLDMLEDSGNGDVRAIANGVDIHLNGVTKVAIDQDRARSRDATAVAM